MATHDAFIVAVREYANAHYGSGGWDILVECWDDKHIARTIEGAKTAQQAIRMVKAAVGHMDDYRRDIQGA